MHRLYFIFITLIIVSCSSKNEVNIFASEYKIRIETERLNDLKHEGTINIYVWNKEDNKPSQNPLEGRFKFIEDDVLEFVPNFPFVANTQYLLVAEAKGKTFQKRFALPKKELKPLEVSKIYPTSDILPENLLRAYIEFSNPMKTSYNLEHIKLINSKGEEIKGAIFNNAYELWDASQKQLTIIFDPARVKTNLIANKSLGRALQPGQEYSLQIDSVQDIYGQMLKTPFIKTFRVVNQDTITPNTKYWKITTPKSKTTQPIQIRFNGAVDRMSLLTRIQVFDKYNNRVEGNIVITDYETSWHFKPKHHWEAGKYQLIVNSRLADPSGNNLNGLFDHQVGHLKSEKEGELIKLPLLIK